MHGEFGFAALVFAKFTLYNTTGGCFIQNGIGCAGSLLKCQEEGVGDIS